MGKRFARGVLAFYVVILIWLVLFKLQYDIPAVFHYHHRSLNLIPFAASSVVNGSFGEMIENVIIFIPLGLLLNVNFKRVGFLPKLVLILVVSLAFEVIQYIFAIGATDITDVMTNTFGGFLGLGFYGLLNKFMDSKKLDRAILFVGLLVLVYLVYYRTHLKIRI